jgi:transcriptional regulator with XRE-family HTH domain
MTNEDLMRWLREVDSLGDVLRRLREDQQLSLSEVAEYAGVAQSYVSMLERGLRTPERDTLIALLLAGFSLTVPQASRIMLFAGFAPLHHRALALGGQQPSLSRSTGAT